MVVGTRKKWIELGQVPTGILQTNCKLLIYFKLIFKFYEIGSLTGYILYLFFIFLKNIAYFSLFLIAYQDAES